MIETKADLAKEIAEHVDGLDPKIYEDNERAVYFNKEGLRTLKRWVIEHDDSQPEVRSDA